MSSMLYISIGQNNYYKIDMIIYTPSPSIKSMYEKKIVPIINVVYIYKYKKYRKKKKQQEKP